MLGIISCLMVVAERREAARRARHNLPAAVPIN
eukprot:SAG31_NODE_608_length_13576_cov_23.757290_1_plen_32_part_10